MQCHICNTEAERLPTGGDFEKINCPDCGLYQISGSLLAIKRDRQFDLAATHEMLSFERLRDEIPLISTLNESLLQ